MAQLVKNLPGMQETWVRCLGWEDPLEMLMAFHSSILACRIPWGLKESDMTEQLALHILKSKMKQTKLNKRFDLTQVILNIFSTCIQTLKSY